MDETQSELVIQLQGVEGQLVDLGYADGEIAGLAGLASGLTCDTRDGYVAVSDAIRECVKMRTGIEKSRKQMKKAGLEWGRKVDSAAKSATERVVVIETPLKEMKFLVDEAKRIAKEEKLMAVVREREAKEKAERDKLDAKRKADNELIRKEQEAENKRLAAVRAEFEKEQEQARKVREEEQRRLAEEQEKVRLAQEAIDKAEAKIEDDKAEATRMEQERQYAIARKSLEEEQAKAEALAKVAKQEADKLIEQANREEAEARKPDAQKLREMVGDFRYLPKLPEMTTEWGATVLRGFETDIGIALKTVDDSLPVLINA